MQWQTGSAVLRELLRQTHKPPCAAAATPQEWLQQWLEGSQKDADLLLTSAAFSLSDVVSCCSFAAALSTAVAKCPNRALRLVHAACQSGCLRVWLRVNDVPVLLIAAEKCSFNGHNTFIDAMMLTGGAWSVDDYMALACCKGRLLAPLLARATTTLCSLLHKMVAQSRDFTRLMLQAEPQCLADCTAEGAAAVLESATRVGLDAAAFLDETQLQRIFRRINLGRGFAVLWPALPTAFLDAVSLDTLWTVVVHVLWYDGVDGIVHLEQWLSASTRAAVLQHRGDFVAPTTEGCDIKLATVAHVAASLGNAHALERLQHWRAAPQSSTALRCAHGRTPLMLASRFLRPVNTAQLFDCARQFGDVDETDDRGATALMYAAVGDLTNLFAPPSILAFVRRCLQVQPSALRARDNQRRTPLMWAAARGYPDVLAYLMHVCSGQKAAFEDVDIHGHCALWFAASANHSALHALLPVYHALRLRAQIREVVMLLADKTEDRDIDSRYMWPVSASFQDALLKHDGDRTALVTTPDYLKQRHIWLWETTERERAVVAPQQTPHEDYYFVTLLLGCDAPSRTNALPLCVTLAARWFDFMLAEPASSRRAFMAACRDGNREAAYVLLHGTLDGLHWPAGVMCFPESQLWMTATANLVLLKWECCALDAEQLARPPTHALLFACLALFGACTATAHLGTYPASDTMAMPIHLYKRVAARKLARPALFVTCVHMDPSVSQREQLQRCADAIDSAVCVLKDEAWRLEEPFCAAVASCDTPLHLGMFAPCLEELSWSRAHMAVRGLHVAPRPGGGPVLVCIATSRELYDKSLITAKAITRQLALKLDASKPPVSFVHKCGLIF